VSHPEVCGGNVHERLIVSEEGQPFPPQSRVWANNAALACKKRAFVFVKAEEHHLRTFQAWFESNSNQLRLDDDAFLCFLRNLASLHIDRQLSQPERMASLGPGNAEGSRKPFSSLDHCTMHVTQTARLPFKNLAHCC
jgi:hypothetical protein